MLRKTYSAGLILTTLVTCLSACGDGEGDAKRRLLPAEKKAIRLDAEAQRVRDMQRVKYIEHDSDGRESTKEASAEDLVAEIGSVCSDDLEEISSQFHFCVDPVARYVANLCTAEALLGAAQVRAAPYTVRSSHPLNERFLAIPQQNHAANAALARQALYIASNIQKGGTFLKVAQIQPGEDYTDFCNYWTGGFDQHWPMIGPNGDVPLGEGLLGDSLIHVFERSNEIAHEAAYLAADSILAVSDAERSSVDSIDVASYRAWMQPSVSRLAAAQIIIGGQMGIASGGDDDMTDSSRFPAQFPLGFCPNRPLSANAQRAIQLLRAAAPMTEMLVDTASMTTERLLSDDASVPDGAQYGSVPKRLRELYHDPSLPSGIALTEHFGLSLQDFEEARQYLVDEIAAFGRDKTVTLQPTPGGTYLPYSAVRAARQDAPDAFYVALAVGSGSANGAEYNFDVPPTSLAYHRVNTLERLSKLQLQAAEREGVEGGQRYAFTDEQVTRLLATAGTMQSAIKAETAGLWIFDGPMSVYCSYDETAGRKHIVLSGESAMTCATTGLIEGKPCDQADLTTNIAGELADQGITIEDNGWCTLGDRRYFNSKLTGMALGRRYYLVRERVAGLAGPGRYELQGAAEWRRLKAGRIPGASSDYAKVADMLRPSKEWCNHPRRSCAGASFDERIPLEDELTNDGDGVESSWKHYLALAKQAAQESDDLGSSYVLAGLEVDRDLAEQSIREEQKRQQINSAFETIQNTCGTSIDVQRIMNLVMGTPGRSCNFGDDSQCRGAGLVCSSGGVCQRGYRSCTSDGNCGNGASCVTGLCVPDIRKFANDATVKSDVDVQRLIKCMAGELYDFVALGDAPLCVGSVKGNAYCTNGDTDTTPCPRLRGASDACTGEVAVSRSTGPASTTETLGMFHVEGPQEETTNDVCDAIGTIRTSGDSTTRRAALETIKKSKLFLPENVKDTANRVGFEARLGSYATITLDGSPVFLTGDYAAGPNYGQWPCAAQGQGTAPSTTGGLWSQEPISCTDEMQRGAINDRWMRAVILARVLGGNPFARGIKVPGWWFGTAPKVNATYSRTLRNTTTGVFGTVSERTMTQGDSYSAHVYATSDQTANNLTAYVTRLDGNLVQVPIQGKFAMLNGSSSPAWFAIGDFYPYFSIKDVEGKAMVRSDGVFHLRADKLDSRIDSQNWSLTSSDRQIMYVGTDSELGFDAFPDLRGLVDEGSRTALRIGSGGEAAFDSVTVEQYYDGLSTGLRISDENVTSEANEWPLKQLENLVRGNPLKGLSTHVLNVGHFSSLAVTGSLARAAIPLHDTVRLSGSGMLDALEVLCRVRVAANSGVKPNLNLVPSVSSADDLPVVRAYLENAARRIESWASRFVIPKFPKLAADFLREESNSGVVPVLGGTYATTMTTLRGALVELAQVSPLMAYELRQLGNAVEQARIATAKTDLASELAELNFASQMANNAAACAGAAVSTEAKATLGASAAVACTNAIVQGIIAAKQLAVQKKDDDLDKQSAINTFQQQLNAHAQALQTYSARVSKALEDIDGMVAELERQRIGAKRAFAEAIRLGSFTPTSSENASAVLVRQRETARVRYVAAFDNAKRMGFLASRAIEQRLGLLLADMRDDLPLVDAPNNWVGTVCDRSGINYDNIRATIGNSQTNYESAFIGEYVNKLERVVESYRLENNFHEGSDTAVISLRDDVLNVKAPCSVATKNLLPHTADLDTAANADGTNGWRATGCIPRVDGQGQTLPPQNCITVVPSERKFPASLGEREVYRWNRMYAGKEDRTTCGPNECDYQAQAAWSQHVRLEPGIYRMSYLDALCGSNCQQSNVVLSVVDSASGQVVRDTWEVNPKSIGGGTEGWQYAVQRYGLLKIQVATELELQFRPSANYRSVTAYPAVFTAPMLEQIFPDPLPALEDEYKLYPDLPVTTSGDGKIVMNSCDDTDGSIFRATGWSMGALPLCPDGFAGSCSADKVQIHKFWQIPFSIYQRDIEAGRILKKAGFARGNFNYRIESVALNFVGTGVRNCEGSDSPSTCYSGGFVPYSLDHIGPYTVRNHFGGDFTAQLFTGHIEHARGLAAERYITNPVSSADQQLLESFTRSELQGRPVDGNFVIRLWEEPGTYFDGIEDIQVVLKYRYWTRFD